MSLAEQSQQWYPTSVKVTVLQARNLRIKGKNGTNDAYAIMQVAKDKFCTAVAEKSVSPVWKEEATFELPLFHQANAERCTLHVMVMHRGLVNIDKMLGQAIVNLVELQEDKSRNKTEWFKLVNKSGKQDKERGEVQLDIQFLRNNMTASMFDLSSQDKPRSRMGKLKDKLRGKKKEGASDSASAIVPSVTQALTDSEPEEEAGASAHADGSASAQKTSKLTSLLVPKTNLQRNTSQSMGSLTEGGVVNEGSPGSPEGKKKLGFLTHKRSGSSDSKVSHGPLSLLSRHKPTAAEQVTICINGNHVYVEEPDPKSAHAGSALSLTEEKHWGGKGHDEHESKRQEEQVRKKQEEEEKKKLEEQEHKRQERIRLEEQEKKRQEEQERKKREEDERKKLEEQERKRQEKIRLEEQEKKRQDEQERKKQEEEEKKKVEDQERKRQERIRLEEQEKKRQEEQERKKLEEQERKRQERIRLEEQEKKRQEEQERKRQERIRLEEQEKKRQEEQERKKLEEQERKRQERIRLEEQEKKRQEEQEMKKHEEEERKKLEEQERKRQEKIRLEEQEKKRQEEEERKKQEEEERKRLEEQERKRQEIVRLEVEERKRQEETCQEMNKKVEQRYYEEKQLEGQKQGKEAILNNPFEQTHSSNPFEEEPVMQPEESHSSHSGVLTRLSRVSAVKPSIPHCNAPVPSADSLAHGCGAQPPLEPSVARVGCSAVELIVCGERKHRAPLPPGLLHSAPSRNPATVAPATSPAQPAPGLCADREAAVPRTSLQRGKRPAPQPPHGATVCQLKPTLEALVSECTREDSRESPNSEVKKVPSLLKTTGQKPGNTATLERRDAVKAQMFVSSSASTVEVPIDGVTKTFWIDQEGSTNFSQKEAQLCNDPLGTEGGCTDVEVRSRPSIKGEPEENGLCAQPVVFLKGCSQKPDKHFVLSSKGLVSMKMKEDEKMDKEEPSQGGGKQLGMKGAGKLHYEMDRSSGDICCAVPSIKKKPAPMPPLKVKRKDMCEVTQREAEDSMDTLTHVGNPVKEAVQLDRQEQAQPQINEGCIPLTSASHGGRSPLHVRVPFSEAQAVRAKKRSDGGRTADKVGGLASNPCRRHPVKPLRSAEIQEAQSVPAEQIPKSKEAPVALPRTSKEKTEGGDGGPYSQLTPAELISMVMKQQAQLAERDRKVRELEDYIDNLLVRIMEDNPSILMNTSTVNKAC